MLLEKILTQRIKKNGPLSMAEFMEEVLGHPEHGYYMTRDPLGRGGDFTTAPEVSQLFGEMIGVWVADTWRKLGEPGQFVLLECGPGRGTLMADILRATQKVSGFHKAADVVLMEMSPVLRQKQEECLADYDVRWVGRLSDLKTDVPMIVVGNEFLDALPICQLVRCDGGWSERDVNVDDNGLFYIIQNPLKADFFELGQEWLTQVQEDEIAEVSPARDGFMRELSVLIKTRGGAALFIDYGHEKSAPGDTLQAVYKHDYCDVLEHIGHADLTAHVDFEALGRAAADLYCQGIVTQGRFLKNLGIGIRAQVLKQKADEKQGAEIDVALRRLCGDDEMGVLFKVIGFSHDKSIKLAGF